MKIIFILFLFISSNLYAIENDKIAHAFVSYKMTEYGNKIYAKYNFNNPMLSSSITTLIIMGLGKEIIYDKLLGYGTPSWNDMFFNCAGIACANISFYAKDNIKISPWAEINEKNSKIGLKCSIKF